MKNESLPLSHLSLFTGIGGLDLAAEWAGFQIVGQCEWADYPTKVLEKHWPRVPRWRDIRTLTKDSFHEQTGLQTVDLVSGGFPCHPFSLAGNRRGKEDDRYLWPEMLRVIEELRPRWVIGENVVGIVSMALDTVLADLESIGYTCQAFIVPACAVDAPHRRDRVCLVGWKGKQTNIFYPNAANTEYTHIGKGQKRAQKQPWITGLCENVPYANCFNGGTRRPECEGQPRETGLANGGNDVPHADRQRLQGREQHGTPYTGGEAESHGPACKCGETISNPNESAGNGGRDYGGRSLEHDTGERRTAEPGLGGMADGFPCWMDEPLNVPRMAQGVKDRAGRLKCLGNAVITWQSITPASRLEW